MTLSMPSSLVFIHIWTSVFIAAIVSQHIRIERHSVNSATVISFYPKGWISRGLSMKSSKRTRGCENYITDVIYCSSPLNSWECDEAVIEDEHFCSLLCDRGFRVHAMFLPHPPVFTRDTSYLETDTDQVTKLDRSYADDYVNSLAAVVGGLVWKNRIPARSIAIAATELAVPSVLRYLNEVALPMTDRRVDIGAVILVDPTPIQALHSKEGKELLLRRYWSPLISLSNYINAEEDAVAVSSGSGRVDVGSLQDLRSQWFRVRAWLSMKGLVGRSLLALADKAREGGNFDDNNDGSSVDMPLPFQPSPSSTLNVTNSAAIERATKDERIIYSRIAIGEYINVSDHRESAEQQFATTESSSIATTVQGNNPRPVQSTASTENTLGTVSMPTPPKNLSLGVHTAKAKTKSKSKSKNNRKGKEFASRIAASGGATAGIDRGGPDALQGLSSAQLVARLVDIFFGPAPTGAADVGAALPERILVVNSLPRAPGGIKDQLGQRGGLDRSNSNSNSKGENSRMDVETIFGEEGMRARRDIDDRLGGGLTGSLRCGEFYGNIDGLWDGSADRKYASANDSSSGATQARPAGAVTFSSNFVPVVPSLPSAATGATGASTDSAADSAVADAAALGTKYTDAVTTNSSYADPYLGTDFDRAADAASVSESRESPSYTNYSEPSLDGLLDEAMPSLLDGLLEEEVEWGSEDDWQEVFLGSAAGGNSPLPVGREAMASGGGGWYDQLSPLGADFYSERLEEVDQWGPAAAAEVAALYAAGPVIDISGASGEYSESDEEDESRLKPCSSDTNALTGEIPHHDLLRQQQLEEEEEEEEDKDLRRQIGETYDEVWTARHKLRHARLAAGVGDWLDLLALMGFV